jgi:hypothetical protein
MNEAACRLPVIILTALLLAGSCSWIETSETYLRIALTCTDFDLKYNKFSNPKTVFSVEDGAVVVVAGIGNVIAGVTSSGMKFCMPDGSAHEERSWNYSESGDAWFSHYLLISGNEDFWIAHLGWWRVDVLIDGHIAESLYFRFE